jgi:hypothetical protein
MGAVGEQDVVQFEFLGSSTTTRELFTKVDAPQLDALLNGMLSRNLTLELFRVARSEAKYYQLILP